MSKITNLMTIMTKAQELYRFINETEITIDDINHFNALEPEMAETIENLIAVLKPAYNTPDITDTPTDTTDDNTDTITTEPEKEEVVIAPPITEPIVETTTETTEVWRKTESGVEVSSLGNVRYNGSMLAPKMVGGYNMYYDPELKKYQPLAKTVLTLFKGNAGRSACPLYKDGNRSNCRLNNLTWGVRNPSLSTGQIEKACKIIAENPNMKESDLVNLLVEAGSVRSSAGLRSILSGNYRTISDKYFTVRCGSIIPVRNDDDTTETTAPSTTTNNNTKISINDVRTSYVSRLMAHQPITKNDTSDFVLTYLMDGYDTAEEIQKAIHKDYGRKIMITTSTIKNLIGK